MSGALAEIAPTALRLLDYLGFAWLGLVVLSVTGVALWAVIRGEAPTAQTPWHGLAIYWLGVALLWVGVVVVAGLATAFGLLVLRRMMNV